MKNDSGKGTPQVVFVLAALLIVGVGLLVISRHLPGRHASPAGSSRESAQPTESFGAGGTPEEPDERDVEPRESAQSGREAAPRRPQRGSAAPLRVQPFRGQYCGSVGPPGWVVLAENPQRVSFGADFASADRLAYAGYSIFPSGAMAGPGFETPGRAVAAALSAFGTIQVRYGAHRQLAPNVFLLEYVTPSNHGVAFYQVIPAGSDGAMVVMRLAGTSASPGQWESRGAEAMAVARALVCQVPMVPASPDPPGLNSRSASGSNNGEEADTLYNTWLEREYYHNPTSGENYWVSPSENYSQTGPDGPGYYATYGGSLIKLAPGYSSQ